MAKKNNLKEKVMLHKFIPHDFIPAVLLRFKNIIQNIFVISMIYEFRETHYIIIKGGLSK
jgi:hypothetical protein